MAFDAVYSQLIFPTSEDDFARDIDGDGKPDNRLGALLAGLGPFLVMQAQLDSAMQLGKVINLLRIEATSLATATSVSVQVLAGLDGDADPTNNTVAGTSLRADPLWPRSVLTGSIEKGRLRARGSAQLRSAFSLDIPFNVPAVPLLVEALITETGLEEGILAGAIPWEQVKTEVLAPLGKELASRDWFRLLLDTDKDGKVSVEELTGNALVGPFIAPDLDLDKDGTPDALSFGMAFSGVRCYVDVAVK